MAFLFGKSKHKSPSELLKSTKENLQKLEGAGDPKKVPPSCCPPPPVPTPAPVPAPLIPPVPVPASCLLAVHLKEAITEQLITEI